MIGSPRDRQQCRRTLRALAAIPLLALLGACSGERIRLRAAEVSARIAIDPTARYQRMTGWEAGTEAGEERADFPLYRDRLIELAVDSLGINRLRVPIRSGVENVRDYWSELQAGRLRENWRCVRYATTNDNADPNVIDWRGFKFAELDNLIEKVVLPLKARVESRGEHLFLNLNYVAFYTQCRTAPVPYIHTDPEEYAEFILAASLHLRSRYGLVPDTWEVVLEPDNTPFWRGEQLGRAIVAAGRRLRAAGFTPRFIAPSTTSMAAAAPYFDELARVPGAVAQVSELSYHRYRDVGPDKLKAIAERGRRYHVATAMLEHIGSDYRDLYRDIAIGGASAWEQFVLAFGESDDGSVYFVLQPRGRAAPGVVMASRTRFLRQYFRYIRAGAQRIGATTDQPGVAPLAFINPDGRYVVVVNADGRGDVSVSNLPAGRYDVSYTTADTAVAAAVTLPAGQSLSASIPAAGVLTIAGAAPTRAASRP